MKIAIAYVPKDTSEADIAQLCAAFTSIQGVRLAASRAGGDRAVAIVDFADPGEAAQAIALLDATEFAGRPIRVREASPTESGRFSDVPRATGNTDDIATSGHAPARLHPRDHSALLAGPSVPARALHAALWAVRNVVRVVSYVLATALLVIALAFRAFAAAFALGGRGALRGSGWRHPLNRHHTATRVEHTTDDTPSSDTDSIAAAG